MSSFADVKVDMKLETYDCSKSCLDKHVKTIDLIFLIDCDENGTVNVLEEVSRMIPLRFIRSFFEVDVFH